MPPILFEQIDCISRWDEHRLEAMSRLIGIFVRFTTQLRLFVAVSFLLFALFLFVCRKTRVQLAIYAVNQLERFIIDVVWSLFYCCYS